MKADIETNSHQKHIKALMESATPMTKLDADNDSRMVPGANWIRASGLDELPQIVNILRGEMSIVGPRPCIPFEYELYKPGHRARCNAAPGLTGLWQVSGKNRLSFERMIALDIEYSQRKTLWLDESWKRRGGGGVDGPLSRYRGLQIQLVSRRISR